MAIFQLKYTRFTSLLIQFQTDLGGVVKELNDTSRGLAVILESDHPHDV